MSNTEEKHHIITAMRIEKLTPGRACWFWLAQCGPEKEVSLYLHPIKRDPLAKTFVEKVQEKRKTFQQSGIEIKGQLQRTEKGTLLLTSPDPIAKCTELFTHLSSSSTILGQSLSNIVVVESKGGAPQKIKTWASPHATDNTDVSEQEAILTGITDSSGSVFFWLGVSESSKQPHLFLASDKPELRKTVNSTGKPSGVSGEVVRSNKGYLIFRTQKPAESFLEDLSFWYKKHRIKNPGLRTLRKSRMIYKNSKGEILDRQKNDTLW